MFSGLTVERKAALFHSLWQQYAVVFRKFLAPIDQREGRGGGAPPPSEADSAAFTEYDAVLLRSWLADVRAAPAPGR